MSIKLLAMPKNQERGQKAGAPAHLPAAFTLALTNLLILSHTHTQTCSQAALPLSCVHHPVPCPRPAPAASHQALVGHCGTAGPAGGARQAFNPEQRPSEPGSDRHTHPVRLSASPRPLAAGALTEPYIWGDDQSWSLCAFQLILLQLETKAYVKALPEQLSGHLMASVSLLACLTGQLMRGDLAVPDHQHSWCTSCTARYHSVTLNTDIQPGCGHTASSLCVSLTIPCEGLLAVGVQSPTW